MILKIRTKLEELKERVAMVGRSTNDLTASDRRTASSYSSTYDTGSWVLRHVFVSILCSMMYDYIKNVGMPYHQQY